MLQSVTAPVVQPITNIGKVGCQSTLVGFVCLKIKLALERDMFFLTWLSQKEACLHFR
jgi:hypothetical protein